MYRKFYKRMLDCLISLSALIVLSPLLFLLTIVGAVIMQGNPFFVQQRVGWQEKIFNLIKFRTMTNKKDKDGKLLPDEDRLLPYGHFLRSTSLDEIPELINILRGDMSLVGPRPLLVRYLTVYTEAERHRHDVRPGLTGLAQVHGRNFLSWEERFAFDLEYVKKISFKLDLNILWMTIKIVFRREGIGDIKIEEKEKDCDGHYWITYKGEKHCIYLPLDEERKLLNNGNRKAGQK